ncbi:MAG: acyl-CoA dehydrogenase C-terminal domain-containing protein, partial [Acidimicrobiales bacterium]|nr:acyl-CoA dehydrogenase C-terminal domain-containing protein [Acidimicrobiales bacterium]
DAQAHIGKMVEHLMASMGGEAEEIYKVGLQATPLLETISEVVIAWLMLRQAEVALPKVDEDPFYEGKVAAARWLVRDVTPKVAARARRAQSEAGALMDLPVEAF